MDRGKFEPGSFDTLMRWEEKNCERCLRFKIESDYSYAEDSCLWSRQYSLFATMGSERPSEEIINNMFNLPHCSGLERSDLQGDQ